MTQPGVLPLDLHYMLALATVRPPGKSWIRPTPTMVFHEKSQHKRRVGKVYIDYCTLQGIITSVQTFVWTHRLSDRSVLLPTSTMITSLPRSVRTSSIHLDVWWNDVASNRPDLNWSFVRHHLTNNKLVGKHDSKLIWNMPTSEIHITDMTHQICGHNTLITD